MRGIDFDVGANEVLGIVGESGSARASPRWPSAACCRPEAAGEGSIELDGVEITTLDAESLRRMRGRDVGMVFQDPDDHAQPGVPRSAARSIEGQVSHGQVPRPRPMPARWNCCARSTSPTRKAARCSTAPVLRRHAPARRDRHGHVGRPRLIIADEPTTALDVTVQAQVLAVLARRQKQTGAAVIPSRTTWAWWPRWPTAWP